MALWDIGDAVFKDRGFLVRSYGWGGAGIDDLSPDDILMRGSAAKKLRQLYNRQYREKLEGEFVFLHKILRPKPGWLPMKLWRGIGGIFFREMPLKAYAQVESENSGGYRVQQPQSGAA